MSWLVALQVLFPVVAWLHFGLRAGKPFSRPTNPLQEGYSETPDPVVMFEPLTDPLLAEFEKLEQQVADECEHDALHGGDPKKAARVRARMLQRLAEQGNGFAMIYASRPRYVDSPADIGKVEPKYSNDPAFLHETVDADAAYRLADAYFRAYTQPRLRRLK